MLTTPYDTGSTVIPAMLTTTQLVFYCHSGNTDHSMFFDVGVKVRLQNFLFVIIFLLCSDQNCMTWPEN
jgi:hypothetical protein